ncbi:MarR family winged helix-turn-helix transcriptional regulator [Amycolatopsis vancoresmycina]|uniref:Transcriptional regulatory protein n=1 Tax=Amycolatopsis vancoresmycina DSM 44592 TaxID=1292037 RepID=R1GH90_9PSEU|nr:MarR family transcriptional regulator [Amycolatopsis vancoresmycina]EOD70627.1 transcriptional regulatory protein [Amycolatopsis vancoresmycina DSM 44592]
MESLRDEPLGYLLHRVTAALRAEVAATVLGPADLAHPGYLCLRMLARSPKSNAELAREAQVSPQAMNKVVRELQERGLVTRPATVPSGRSLPATLTREGVTLLARLDPAVAEAEDRVLAGLGDHGRRELRRLLVAASRR